jgi:hypothetical protein
MESDDPAMLMLNEGMREIREIIYRIDVGDEGVLKNASKEIFKDDVIIRPMVFKDSELAALADMSTPEGIGNMEIAILIRNSLGI